MTDLWMPVLGGALIGVGAALPLLFLNRVVGASGILADLYAEDPAQRFYSLALVTGIVAVAFALSPEFTAPLGHTTPLFWIAILLMGIGARLGGGCTSGHGVCGMGRLSKRSIIATVIFLVTAMIVATLKKEFIG